jgi:hypothetical protein
MARSRYDLGEPANTDLVDFCEALDDATQKTVLNRALSQYIRKVLDENDGIRRRYEEIRRRRSEG